MKTINRLRFWQLFCLLITFLGGQQVCHATHAVGADLTYQCVGGNTYEITLRFYRDCGGSAAPTGATVSIAGNSGCPAVTSSLALSSVSSQEVSQVCAGTQTSCSGGSTQGTQEYLYTGQVTLPSGCDSYTISYELLARNGAITNLVVSTQNTAIYVETVINTALAPCNNSPQFNNLPVLYGCPGQQIQFNHGFFDSDGDSLSFSLINPKQAGGANIPFVSGLSPTTPLNLATGTTFQFNNSNGQMTFTPQASTGQVAVISVLIEEYRNGQKIGSMIRDLQMIILANCSSTAPAVGTVTPSSGTVTNNVITYCGGPALSINFSISDPDVADVLTATSDISTIISGATISVTGTNPITVQLNVPTATLPSGSYPFTITINDGGCPIPNVQIIGYNLQVNNNPPAVSISANNTTVCEGQTINMTASGASTYNWGGGVTGSAVIATPTSNSTYSVIGTTNGCSDTASINITVNPSPTVQINTSSNSICIGEQVTLTVSGNGTSYSWDNGVTNGTPFNPTSTNTYTATGTGANGCTNSSQVTIFVNSLPNVVANATKTTICQGEQITLSGSGATSYVWDNGVTDGVAFTPSSNSTYNVTGTNGNGCSNTAQIAITYNNTPPPTASISTPTNQICQGNSTILTGTVNTGESIAWYRNGNVINGATAATYTVTQGGNYYNIVTNSSGCTDISSIETISTSAVTATPGNISGNKNLCYGEREDYSISSINGATSYTWTISPSSAASISSGQGTNTVKVNSTNVDFQLSVVANNTCGSSNPSSDNIDLDNGFSCSDIAFAANNTAICEGESVTFSNYTNSNTVIGLTARWDFGAGASPATATGSGPHTVTYNTSGLKTVELEYVDAFGFPFNGETYTDYINVTSTTNCGVGVATIANGNTLHYYPNPTNDIVVIDFDQPISGTLKVFNVQGLFLKAIDVTTVQNLKLSLKDYPSGLYLVAIQTDKKIYTLKITKE